MSFDRVAALVQTVLYEGYLLYPYRPSSLKNQHRWMFGTVYPRDFAEAQHEGDRWWTQTEVLVRGDDDTVLDVRARFLHVGESGAVERQVDALARALGALVDAPETTVFAFGPESTAGGVRGALDTRARRTAAGLFTVTCRLENVTPFVPHAAGAREHRRDAVLGCAFASAHTLLRVSGGEFVSLIDPPAALREPVAACRNVGAWPVLVGEPGTHAMMLSAPIILDDHPRLAPESAGDFFDATEIDELLTLRVLTLTDDEKQAMQRADPRARTLLERTEALADEQRRRLHGIGRTRGRARARDHALRAGVRVRLVPRPGGDIFDLALAGRTATVVNVEENYEGDVFVAVTVDDDPGRDLGLDGRPGHRFFFRPEEVEIVP